MVQAAESYLDADELMHLALTAIREGKTEEGIITLKRALALAPNDAGLHYLLGAQYARIGLNERAVQEIGYAITLNPSLDGARFQLGWIYMTHGHVEPAAEVWKAFDELGEGHPLYLFKTGLLHLAKDELTECEAHLRRGIAANTVNDALNYDMAQILKQIQSRRVAAQAAAKTEPPAKAVAPKVEAAAKAQAAPKTEPPAKPEAPSKPQSPVKAETAPKPDTSSSKPKTPKNVVLSAYQQNKPEDHESE